MEDNGLRICFNEEARNVASIKVICRRRRQQRGQSHDRFRMEHIEFIVANTDLQALRMSRASTKIQLGVN